MKNTVFREKGVGQFLDPLPCGAILHIGNRSSLTAITFIDDLASRLANRIQITTDGHQPYSEAIEGSFGGDVDYAILHKVYGASPDSAKGRYSPAECIGIEKYRIEGNPTRRTYRPVLWSGRTSQ
jgi:hypothetical protein